jgi:uncharacterized repeat protein (TIGR01451 family)
MISHRQTKALFTVTTFVLLLLSLVAGLKVAGAADSSNVNLVAQIGGETRGVATYGQYAYVGVGPQLLILNVANPLNPTVVHQTGPLSASGRPDEIIEDVTIVDETGYVYLAAGDGGFYIVNVGSPLNPTTPTVVGHYDTDGYASAVDVSGNYAVVADDLEGIVALNISNKAAPTLAQSFLTGDDARDVALGSTGIEGEIYAFVAAGTAGVEVYEITPVPGYDGAFPLTDYAEGITLNPALGQVYVADGAGGLQIVDITNTVSLSLVGSAATLSLAEDTAYFGSYVFVADADEGIRVFDVTNPANPAPVISVNTPGYGLAVATSNNRAFLADSWSGLRIIDFGNINNVYEIGSYTSVGAVNGLAAAASGGYLYSASGDMGLVSTDVSDRSHPTKASTAVTADYAQNTALAGDYAYVADWAGGLRVVDTAVPTNLSEAGSLATLDASLDVAISGNYAYVADGLEGLFIADITNPAAPAYVTSLGTPDLPDAEGLDLSGSYAFVAGGADGLHAVNISNPALPTVADTLPLSGLALDAAVFGNYAYVAADDGGLQIVNVSDPGNLAWVSEVSAPTLPNALGVTVVGHYALVAAGYDGLIVLDVTTPAAPTVAGHYNTAGYAVSVAVNGAVYVGDVEGGLYVLNFNNFDFGVSDLAVSVTDNASTAVAGATLTYTITIANLGPSDVTGATVTDNFPAALTGVTWSCAADTGSACGTASGSDSIASSVDLEAGDTATFTAVGTLSSSASGTLSNTASTAVPGGITDDNTTNNSANDTTALTTETDLQITQIDAAGPVIPGTPLTYTITISNAGPSDMTGGLTLIDTLPTDVTFVSATPGSPDCAHAAGVVTCSLGTLAASASTDVTIIVNVAPTVSAALVNEASVSGSDTDPNSANNTATATTAIGTADLSVTLLDAPNPVVAGETLTYTIEVTNHGPDGATGVTLTDALPSGVELVTAVPGSPTCTETAGTLTCNLGDLAASASTQISIITTVDSTATGALANTATVSASEYDGNQTNNSAAASTQVNLEADLQISLTDGTTVITAGELLTYTITVNNAGPSAVSGATVTDNFPADFSSVTWTCAGTGGGVCAAGNGSGNVNTEVDLPVNGQAVFTAVGTIANTATGLLVNEASVAAPNGVTDPNVNNNTASDSDSLGAAADVRLTGTAVSASATINTQVTHVLTVTNNGPSAASGVVVNTVLPANAEFVSSDDCTLNGGQVSCTIGTLAQGASATVSLVVKPLAKGTLTCQYTLFAVNDSTSGNNIAVINTTIDPYTVFLPVVIR